MATTFIERTALLTDATNRAVAVKTKFRRALSDIRGLTAEIANIQSAYSGAIADAQTAAEAEDAPNSDLFQHEMAQRFLAEAAALAAVAEQAATGVSGIEA